MVHHQSLVVVSLTNDIILFSESGGNWTYNTTHLFVVIGAKTCYGDNLVLLMRDLFVSNCGEHKRNKVIKSINAPLVLPERLIGLMIHNPCFGAAACV